MDEVQFLFDNQLIAELENLIKNAKHRLLLISPFIDLDKRIQDALRDKLTKHNFELLVLFGKNEDNCYKSIKKDSLDFLKQFPKIEIRYNDRLHAKFYQNDFDFIMTSINLYDYSLAKNIEVGIKGNFASKGLIGKVTDTMLIQSDKVTQTVFGTEKNIDPIEKFRIIFENSDLKYKTEPIIGDKEGLKGVFGSKKLNGFNVIIDNLSISIKEIKSHKAEFISRSYIKTISASHLSISLGISLTDITNLLQRAGFIQDDKITATGLSKGLVMKNYMGKDYISYPENLVELNELKKKI